MGSEGHAHECRDVTLRGKVEWGTALVLAWAIPVGVSAQQSAKAATPLVFDGVTVVDVEYGKLVPNQRVVIRGNRIRAIGSAGGVRLPKGAQVVEARGKYVIPGLWDMHVHPMAYVDIAFPLFIANGVTGVRDAGSPAPLATLTQWKREIAAGTRVGPRLLVSGSSIDEGSPGSDVVQRGYHISVPPEAVRRVVDSFKAAGADMIKTYAMSRTMYFALASEARRIGIMFGGHLPREMTGLEASDSGAKFLDHDMQLEPPVCGSRRAPEALDPAQCAAVGQRLRRNGTWFTWTPFHMSRTVTRDEARARLRYWPDAVARDLLTDTTLINAMNARCGCSIMAESFTPYVFPGDSTNSRVAAWAQAGIPLLAATDVAAEVTHALVPGFSLQDQLMWVGESGLSPLAVLQSATLHPAQALGFTDSLGTVASGKVADLVLLDHDPLADIHNISAIRAVVANGRYFDRAALDQLLAEVQAKAKNGR